MNSMHLNDQATQRAWVRYELAKRGMTLIEVAASAGVSKSALYSAFRRPYPRMEWLIATAVGVLPQQIWPERYTAEGLPNRLLGRPPKNNNAEGAKFSPRAEARSA